VPISNLADGDNRHPKAIAARTFWQIVTIVRWLTIARLDRKPPLIHALLVTGAVTVVGLTLDSAQLKLPAKVSTYDAHAFWSLDLAIDWVYCGKYSAHSPTYDLTHYLIAHNVEMHDLPLPTILERVGGSREQYCSAVTEPFLNNENSLFYLYSALLYVHPGVTLAGLGVLLIWIRVASLVFFVFTLACVGASPVFALVTLMLGVEIASLSAPTHIYSSYPFLLPFLGIYAGLLTLTLHFELHRKTGHLALAAVLIGLFAGLFFNLRTSYLPIIVGCYLMFVAVIFFEPVSSPVSAPSDRWKVVRIALAGFLVGGALFYLSFTYPLTRTGATFNYTYHPVAHPLVLSLAVPPNALSQREGIRWSDAVGLDLARRVDPNAGYLGPTYEPALLRYYSRLWRQHPHEMLRIYLEKWRLSTTTSAAFVDANMSSLAKRLLGPTRYCLSGISFTVLFLVIVITALYLGPKYNPSAGILVATLAGAGLFVTLESAIIMPFFYLPYHNAQLFVLFVTNLLFFQILVNAACCMVNRRTDVGNRARQRQI
jgi:hypothetical protein